MERRPLRKTEYLGILSIVGALDALTDAIPALGERGQTEALEAVLQQGSEAFRAILATVPVNKLRSIDQDMKHTRIYTKVEAPGIKTVDTEHHRYVPARILNAFVGYVIEHECLMCDKSATEARHCRYRELMEAALPNELEFKAADDRCKWSGVALDLGEWEE